jgi:hypothetical protein
MLVRRSRILPLVWVASGGYPPKAPADPYVRTLAHTVLPIMVWPAFGRSIEPPGTVDARRSGPAIHHRYVDTLADVDASGVVPDDGSMIVRLASLRRVAVDGRSPVVLRKGFITFPIGTTKTLRLPAIPPAALGFPSLGGTTVAPEIRSHARADAPSLGRGVGCRRPPDTPPIDPWRWQDLPSSRRTLCRYAHAPTTPEEPDGTRLHVPPTRPRIRERPRLLQLDFRGSIAWLDDWLSTLRRGGFPPPTQDSLTAAG